jgi:hypothetical protein
MADRFCNNCGNELRPDDKFCPNCGRPVHDTAVVPTPEADVEVPPLPQQGEESSNLLELVFSEVRSHWGCAAHTALYLADRPTSG